MSRVPSGIPLGQWIRQLLAADEEWKFYKTDEWKSLAAAVMEDHNWECERHAERGEYARAQMVHHENEVRDRPEMALTRYVEGPDGKRREVLHPLCNQCHNEVHGRTFRGAKKKPQLNDERW